MTSNPYTPDETELADCYADNMAEAAGEDYDTAKADAERGIVKIKADAWDEGAETAYADAQGALRGEAPTNPYRIEGEANE